MIALSSPLTWFSLAACFLAPQNTPPAEPAPPTPDSPAQSPNGAVHTENQPAPEIARMTVREGYRVSAATPVIDGTRFLCFGSDGTLYISRPKGGDILAGKDTDRDGVYDTFTTLVSDHEGVQAMCFAHDALYFAEPGAIYKATDPNHDGVADEVAEIISGLPEGGTHWWRSLLVTDTHVYTSVGDSGNATDETATDRQKIWRYSLTGSDKALFAAGVRNTEKLLLRPGTQEVWGIDHGSDWFGKGYGENDEKGQPITDTNPPDEFNLYIEGGFYGHPFLVGDRVPRWEFRERADLVELAARTRVPAWKFEAHAAANGWAFVDPAINAAKRRLPEDASGDAFVACRGSWNRADKAGYTILRVFFEKSGKFAGAAGKPFGAHSIVSFLERKDDGTEQAFARPVDCVQAPDGSILFSIDAPRGRVYRISLE